MSFLQIKDIKIIKIFKNTQTKQVAAGRNKNKNGCRKSIRFVICII